ncbi:MAG: OsmC family protein [Armatimonadetes bacterium]|nr:OsmC family protein [Armatimonadota bacterium]
MPDLTVTAQLVGKTLMAARVRDHVVLSDIPEGGGGTDLGPTPSEIFLASLAQCFGMVVAVHCLSRGLDLCEGMKVTVSADSAEEDGGHYWTNIKIEVHFPRPVDERRVKAILRHARQHCAVRRTILSEQNVTVVCNNLEGTEIQ